MDKMEELITYEEVMLRMNNIAIELNLPLDDEHVPLEYFKRYPGLTDELADRIFPIWFTEEKSMKARMAREAKQHLP